MLSSCILAGGESRRFGKNKALINFSGQPLIQRVVNRIENIGNETIIISNQIDHFRYLDVVIKPDRITGCGPLGGLYTGLFYANHPYVAAVACDMPFINPHLLKMEFDILLNSKADVVIPQSSKGLEPLHAIYRRQTCLPPIENALQQDNYQLIGWYDQVIVEILPPSEIHKIDPDELSFININTHDDLIKAIEIVKYFHYYDDLP